YKDGIDIHPLGWSLFVEETFYLFFPLLITYLYKLKTAFILFLFTFLLARFWIMFSVSLDIPTTHGFILYHPFAQWYWFGLGIFVASVLRNKEITDAIKDKPAIYSKMDLCAFIVVGLVLVNQKFIDMAIIMIFLASISDKSIFGKLMRMKILRMFGVVSYSAYLFHFLVLEIAAPIQTQLFEILKLVTHSFLFRFAIWLPIICLVTLAVSIALYNIIEKPSVKLGRLVITNLAANIQLKKLFDKEKE
ncbi:MAG: acyltransferase family protein, partial [Aggregatilineales bacterium]